MCPLSEDFVTSWTSTNCGPKMCPSLKDFVTSWTLTKCGPKICPLLEDFVRSWTSFSYGPTYAAAQEKWQSHSKGRHKPMVTAVWMISMAVVKTKNSRNIEPELIKMMHIKSTTRQKINDKLRKQQSIPNDAALYIEGIGNGFKAFTWTIWRFLRAYAGLLADGFDDNGVCLSRGLIKKTVRSACAFHAHPHALSSDLDFCLLTLFGSLALTLMTFKRNHEKGREDLNWKASQYLAVATRKTESDNPVGLAFGANQIRRGIWFSLYVDVSLISYSELTHRDFPDHCTPQ